MAKEQPKQNRRTWEYRVEDIDSGDADSLQDELNKIGEDGWELVATMGVGFKVRAIFKRAVQP